MADSKKDSKLKSDIGSKVQGISDLQEDLRKSNSEFLQIVDQIGDRMSDNAEIAKESYTSVKNLIKDSLNISSRMAVNLKEVINAEERVNKIKAEELRLQAQITSFKNDDLKVIEDNLERLKEEQKIKEKALSEQSEIYDLKKKEFDLVKNALRNANGTYRTNVANRATLISQEKLLGQQLQHQAAILDKAEEEVMKSKSVTEEFRMQNIEQLHVLEHLENQLTSVQSLKKIYQEILDSVEKRQKAEGAAQVKYRLLNSIMPGAGTSLKNYVGSIKEFGKFGGIAYVTFLALKGIIDSMFRSDQEATDLSRSMGVAKNESRETLVYFEHISNTMNGMLFTSRDIAKSQMQLNNLLGTSMYMRAEDLKTITAARELLGLSEEATTNMAKSSFVSGKNFENIKNQIFGASKAVQFESGILLNDKQVLEATLKVTGAIRANFKGSTTDIAKAVTHAKMLGVTLDQINKTSESLLEFESSISSELEAELLTGKQLNLERARSASLIGDMETVMKEVVKQAGSFEEYTNRNVIAQEKLAKAFGYSREELSDILFEQTALNKMRSLGFSGSQKDMLEFYRNLKAEGKEVNDILGEEVARRYEIQSAQERFNKIIEKLQVMLDRLFQNGVFDNVITKLANVVKYFSEGGSVMKGFFTGFDPENPYSSEDLGFDKLSNGSSSSSNNNQRTSNSSQSNIKPRLENGKVMLDSVSVGVALNMAQTSHP